jgi:CHASE2 domain-containing sensor protein
MIFRVENLIKIFAYSLIPAAWIALEKSGSVENLEQGLLDLRFQYRGELELDPAGLPPLPGNGAAPKVVYVDFDERAVSSPDIGERPWDRGVFAEAGKYLLDEKVGARAIGYDFIFSQNSSSKMVLEESIFRSDRKLAALVRAYPGKVVLGASYNNVSFDFNGEKVEGVPPLLYARHYHKGLNMNYPEGPTYPICYYEDGKFFGRRGILNVDMARGKGAVPRWAPLFFPSDGDAHTKYLLSGHYFSQPLERREEVAGADLAFALSVVEEATQAKEALGHLLQAGKDVQKAEAELSQLEEAAKADPAQAAELKGLVEEQKVIRDALEEAFLDAYKAVGGGDDKPDLTLTVALLETDTKLQALQAELAQKDLDAVLALEDYIPSAPADRSNLAFAKDFEKDEWQLKEGGQVVASIPAESGVPYNFHIAVELVLAAYGLDWQAVEITESSLVIRGADGQEIVHAPLVDKQLVEANWFSRWRVTGEWSEKYIKDPHNPRCSLADVLKYGAFFFDDRIRDAVANYEANLSAMEADEAKLQAQVDADPSLKEAAEPGLANLRRQKKGLADAKDSYNESVEFFSHFKDAIVVVGPVTPTFQDLAPTPFDDAPVPKVGFIGNLLKTLLSGQYLKRAPAWTAWAGVVCLCLPVLALGFCGLDCAKYFRQLGILLVLLYPLVAFQAFKTGNLVLPVVAPTCAVFSLTFAMLMFRKA